MNSMPSPTENFLLDLGLLLRREALDAKSRMLSSRGSSDGDFDSGRLTAYYEVLSLMKQQAVAFGLSEEAISLAGFDPDSNLLAAQEKG
jgi:hypothetical protein